MSLKAVFLCAMVSIFSNSVFPQNSIPDTVSHFKVKVQERRRFYTGNGMDFAMLSTAIVSKPGSSARLTIPRFTAVVNLGFTFNYDLNERFGIFSGIGLRNMGFIEKIGDSTIKRRVYALGVPIGVKIGDLRNRNFIFAGGGIDIPFHYKEKSFVKRSEKLSGGEWFSDKTSKVMPFVFAGYSFDPGITLKLQYYPGNFLNTDYQETTTVWPFAIKPYADYNVHLLLLSLGIDIHYNQYKIQEREYQEQKKLEEQKRLL